MASWRLANSSKRSSVGSSDNSLISLHHADDVCNCLVVPDIELPYICATVNQVLKSVVKTDLVLRLEGRRLLGFALEKLAQALLVEVVLGLADHLLLLVVASFALPVVLAA